MPQLLPLLEFQGHPPWVNGMLFAVAAVLVWLAGTKLSHYADVLSERTALGQALVGLLLLASATSLPEIATTVTATIIGSVPLAVGNLLGGVSMQTAILAVVDAAIVRGGALSRQPPSPVLLLHGILLVLLLTVALTGMALGGGPAILGVGAGTATILALYLAGIYLAQRYERHPRWQPVEPAGASPADREGQPPGEGHDLGATGLRNRLRERYRGVTTRGIVVRFLTGATVILVAGWTIAQTGDALATQTGIGGSLAGFLLVAIATSLPEVSTTVSAARLGAFAMAFANIFGSNLFDTSLLFVADVLHREGPVLAAAEPRAVFGAALGIVLTCVYLWGLVERGDRTLLRMGTDSALVLVLYAAGVVGLFFIR